MYIVPKKHILGPNDTAFPQSDQHPPKKKDEIVSALPALSKAPTVPFVSVLPVKFPVCQGDSFAGYTEGHIIGIDFGSVGAPL